MTTLQPNDTIQPGDIIQRHVAYTRSMGPSHEHRDTKQHPVHPCTHGRIILSADLIAATYYRP